MNIEDLADYYNLTKEDIKILVFKNIVTPLNRERIPRYWRFDPEVAPIQINNELANLISKEWE